MAGVDALLGCLRLEQYRATLDDAVPCMYSRSKYSRSSIAVVSTAPPSTTRCALSLLPWLAACSLSPPLVYLLCSRVQGFDDAWFVVVRMSAAQLDELTAAASTTPCGKWGKQPPWGLRPTRPLARPPSPACAGSSSGRPPFPASANWQVCSCSPPYQLTTPVCHVPGMKPGHAAKLKWEVLRCRDGDATAL